MFQGVPVMNVKIGDTYENILSQIVKDYKHNLQDLANKLKEFEDFWIQNVEYETLDNGDFEIKKIRSSVNAPEDTNSSIEIAS